MDSPQPVRDDDRGPAERLLALSDGVFAIAMTLLALDVTLPHGLGEDGYHKALGDLVPNLWAYVLSFAVIAAIWRGQRRIFLGVREIDGTVLHVSLLGLALVALMPFPTTLLAEYAGRPESVAIYSGAVAAATAAQLALMAVVRRRRWLGGPPPPRTVARNDLVDLASTVLVFGLAVPLAFLSPLGAMWWWAVLVPVKAVLARRGRQLRASAP